MVVRNLLKENVNTPSEEQISPLPSTTEEIDQEVNEDNNQHGYESVPACESPSPVEHLFQDVSCQTQKCLGCKSANSQIRQLRNKIIDITKKIEEQDIKIKQQQETISECSSMPVQCDVDDPSVESDEEMDLDIEEEPQLSEMSSPEHHQFSGTDTETETETDMSEEEPLYPDDEKPKVIKTGQSGNLRTEPKFIVFLSKLLLLFNICPACKSEKPFVEISALGSMVEVTTRCHNPDCPSPRNTWQSQPQMTGTRMPAGNFLLCFSVLLSGASPSKVLQVFKNMGLSCITLKTYFKHQAIKLFPTLYLYWKKYQQDMFAKMKAAGQAMIIAGDGRHDSMGHNAKYCAYKLYFVVQYPSSLTFH